MLWELRGPIQNVYRNILIRIDRFSFLQYLHTQHKMICLGLIINLFNSARLMKWIRAVVKLKLFISKEKTKCWEQVVSFKLPILSDIVQSSALTRPGSSNIWQNRQFSSVTITELPLLSISMVDVQRRKGRFSLIIRVHIIVNIKRVKRKHKYVKYEYTCNW